MGRVMAAVAAGVLATVLGVWATVTVLTPAPAQVPTSIEHTVVATPAPSPVCEPWPDCGLERLAEIQRMAHDSMCMRAQQAGRTDACSIPEPTPTPAG